jgi:hypothetical protein
VDEIEGFRNRQPMSPGSVSLHGRALGPVHALKGVILFRDKSGNGFSSLRNENFFSRSNPTQ